MSLKAFVKKNRLRRKRDDDDTTIVPGKNGHIFDYGDGGSLGVLIMPKVVHPRCWNNARAAFEALGMTITLDCDGEGIATFAPQSEEQCHAAMKHAGISARRVATPRQLTALAGQQGVKRHQNQMDHTVGSSELLQTFLGPQTPHLSGGFDVQNRPRNLQTQNQEKASSRLRAPIESNRTYSEEHHV